jgi:ribosomal protein S18 acetylase RimI-like enzyme
VDNFQIRPLKVEDAEVIGQIYAAITRRPVEPDFKSVVEEHARSGEEACFVAEHQGKVVGFMISYILTAGFGEAKSAWIATLGVDPNFMGQGIGASLAQKIFKIHKAAGIENVYTTVRWE